MAVFAGERESGLSEFTWLYQNPLANIEYVPEQLDSQRSGSGEKRQSIRGHRSFEISRSLRRLRGRSVWSSAIVLLPSRDQHR
jgi:hypothetical protein